MKVFIRPTLWIAIVALILMDNFSYGGSAEIINPMKDPNICGRPICEEENQKFHFQRNMAYKYEYSSHLKTHFDNTGNNVSEMFVTGKIELIFPTPCEGLLKMTNIKLKSTMPDESPSKSKDEAYEEYEEYEDDGEESTGLHSKTSLFANDLQKFDLRFAFHDGIIQEVCPNPEEQIWVLNLKRGVLSTLQNTMIRFDIDHKSVETDISGDCEVSYKLMGSESTSLIIQKVKDISSCKQRYKFNSIVQTTPYEFRKNFVAWWPIFQSSSNCTVAIENYIYDKVECFEHHLFIPFSNHPSGAVTETQTKLKKIGENESFDSFEEDGDPIARRTNLLYDHTPSLKPAHNEIKASRELLKQMCLHGFPNIQRKFPEIFTKFLVATKQLSIAALEQLLGRSQSICSSGKSHVLGSLPYIGSTASVVLMKNLIKKNNMNKDEYIQWMYSLFYLPNPEEPVIDAMFSLLEHRDIDRDPVFVLVPTSVVHTHCKQFKNCENKASVQRIVKYLEQTVLKNLAEDLNKQKVYEDVFVALKGLGNIGIVSRSFEERLKSLIVNAEMSVEIKLQSINVFRRLNCEKNRDFFLDIYRNGTVSSEVRIASYLQSMYCPTHLSIKNVKEFLNKEVVNQVGSFVWSHLKNMASSASPTQVEQQALLADNILEDKFKMDSRKFSKNYEYSLFFDEYNFGVTAESNVIFGTDSFLPRSFFLNLTMNLFGESINGLEVNFRVEGFEHYMQQLFGLQGPLNYDSLMEKLDIIIAYFKNRFHFDTESFPNPLARKRREITEALEHLNNIPFKLKSNYNHPRGYFEYKIFGNDIDLLTFNGMDEFSSVLKRLASFEQLKNIFSGKEEVFTKSGTLFDVSYTVPLISGFPLILNGFGASSLDLRYQGQIKNENFWQTKFLDFSGKIKPSLSMEGTAVMMTDLFYTSTNLKVKTNLYSNYEVETALKLQDTTLLSLKLILPQKRNDILSARSQLVVSVNDEDIQQKGIEHRYINTTCSWPSIDGAIGLKVCVDYELPDVSDTTRIYPSMLLSGPVNFDIHLDKADETAKIFIFDYQWLKNQAGGSQGLFKFETPGSTIIRKFLTNITSSVDGYNISMGFQNGGQIHSAIGLYKNTLDDKRFDFSFSTNDQKHFSLETGVNRSEIRHGHIYSPHFLLTINTQQVAGMIGHVKLHEKKNITQYDVDLRFETKKMQSSLNGSCIKNEASIRTKMLYTYKFSGGQPETIDVEAELANRSQKNKGRLEYAGSMKFVSSGYSYLNYASTVRFLSALGHMETSFTINNAPDLINEAYTLTTKLSFARYNENKEMRTTASIEIVRPKSMTDYKFYIKHEKRYKNGSEHDLLAIVKYSPTKEITTTLSVLLPIGTLFSVDAVFNLTIPEMNSLTTAIKIKEKTRNEYFLDLKGEWFGGQSMQVKGRYQDRTSNVKKFYHLKLDIQSKSFSDISLTTKYSRDFFEHKFELRTEFKEKVYSLNFKSSELSPFEQKTYGEVKWHEQLYTLSAHSLSKDMKKTSIELHFDKYRDIHMELWGVSKETEKQLGVELKWDANRDPSQKVIASCFFSNPELKVYKGNFLLSYPDRTLNGKLEIVNGNPDYDGTLRISWSPNDVIDMDYSMGTLNLAQKKLWLTFKVDTPFDGWRSNKFSSSFFHQDNLSKMNISALWADNQNIGLELKVDYQITDLLLACEMKSVLESTIKDIPAIHAYFNHNQNSDKIDTEISIKHKLNANEIFKDFSVKSGWKFSTNENYRNVTGSLVLKSPFEGYTSGALSTKFSVSNQKKLWGVIDMDVENRLYSLAVEGYLKRFTDNMLAINITTPIEKFSYLNGRFGINEKDRHIVADIKTPNRSLGIELLFDFNTVSDFDIKLYLATPLEAFEKFLVLGKVKPETIHLEGAWNKLNLGFVGVWRFFNYTDFEYSYKVFTPLEKFENNGFVARLIYKSNQNFDVELSLKLAQHKLGAKVFGEPKVQLINQLGVMKATHVKDEFFYEDMSELVDESSEEEFEDDEMDLIQYFTLIGSFEVDTLLWKTIKGSMDIEEVKDTFYCLGKIILPQGTISIKNNFYYPHYFLVKNRMKISTPFDGYKEIKSSYNHKVQLDDTKNYNFGFDVSIQNNKKAWNDYGFKIDYLNGSTVDDLKLHNITFTLLVPVGNTSEIIFNSVIALNELEYHANFSVDGLYTKLKLSGTLENKEHLVDGSFGLSLTSPVLPLYIWKISLKKEALLNENIVDVGFYVNENNDTSHLRSQLSWIEDPEKFVDGKWNITTNLFPFTSLNSSLLISAGSSSIASFEAQYLLDSPGEIKARITKKNLNFDGELKLPLEEFKHVVFQGQLFETENINDYKVTGRVFKNMIPFTFTGTAGFNNSVPVDVDLTFSNPSQATAAFTYKVVDEEFKRSLVAKLEQQTKFFEIDADLIMKHKLNWAYNIKTISSDRDISEIKISTFASQVSKKDYQFGIEMTSPLEHLGLDYVNMSSKIQLLPNFGSFNSTYKLTKYNGDFKCLWKWLMMEDMQFKLNSKQIAGTDKKSFRTALSYINPKKSFSNLQLDGDIDIDSIWRVSGSGVAQLNPSKELLLDLGLKLPAPINSDHKFSAKYKGNVGKQNVGLKVEYDLKYINQKTLNVWESKGSFKNNTGALNSNLRFEWGPGSKTSILDGSASLKTVNARQEFSVNLITPMYLNKKTMQLAGTYEKADIYHIVRSTLKVPQDRQITVADVAFSDLANMKGMLNCSLPFLNVSWLNADFDFSRENDETAKYIKATWPDNFAILDSKSSFVQQGNQGDWKGTIKVEIPLQTKHQAEIVYDFSERPYITNGHGTVEYNDKSVLSSTYTCKSENSVDQNKKVVDLSLDNDFKPIGIHYVHQHKHVPESNDHYDMKHCEVFDLKKQNRFNITGEFIMRIKEDHQDYKLIAIHPNRTIVMTSKYETEKQNTNHEAKLELAPNVWLGYHVEIQNLTNAENDTQTFKLDLNYPTRNLTAKGWYSITDDSFDTDVSLEWIKKMLENDEDNNFEIDFSKPKVMRAGLQWKNNPVVGDDVDNQTLSIVLKHPSFERDICFKGGIFRSAVELIRTEISLQYTDDPYHLVKFDSVIKNLTGEVGYKNMTITVNGIHDASSLELNFEGSFGIQPKLYQILSNGQYKRSYLPMQALDMAGYLDLANKKVKMFRSTPNKEIHVYGRASGNIPVFVLEGEYVDSPEIESKGNFVFNLIEKFVKMEINMTEDASQNIQVYGAVSDTKSAIFNIWRNYDDIRINDVSYFLKMNHSRLITSKLLWRPKLREEIKENTKAFVTSRYNLMTDEIDYWVKTFYTETVDTFTDIWQEAKPYTNEFLDDLTGLQEIEQDITRFRIFLNESYNADDFYFQSFINFTMTILDDLALKDHIESIPKIIREVFQTLGESGQAMRKSVLWLIDTIKNSYKSSLEVFSQLLQGKSLEHLSKFLEMLAQKYDRFIKDLHMSFIKYVERVYNNITAVLNGYWKQMLVNIEPSFIKFVHYIETVTWSVSKEIFDFLHERTNRIMESPYFHRVSDFTRDLDMLYQDLNTNDIFTNIRKYSILSYQFLKEKFLNIVPFGRELNDVITELVEEFKNLKKIDSIQQALKRFEEIQGSVVWLANEFQFEKRLNNLWLILKHKLARITHNALTTDDKYREAKTKFIFDPDIGVIELEQKLPMSWHAFNETPKFEEIPEYKMINDVQMFFISKRNISLWNFYYEYRPFTEPKNLLPPYSSHAILIGSQHFITFDKTFVSMQSSTQQTNKNLQVEQYCSYLLTQDFVDDQFSILMKPMVVQTKNGPVVSKKLEILTEHEKIEIDIGVDHKETIKIGTNQTSLPAAFGSVIVFRDANELTIESQKGFTLRCNLDFEVCLLELSGWYFGSVAGVLGTMNNEIYDDLTKSNNEIASTENEMIRSWRLKECQDSDVVPLTEVITDSLTTLCDSFFKMKTSYFTTCFGTIDPLPFFEMCMNLGRSNKYSMLGNKTNKGACISAISYIEACELQRIPLRVPDVCIHCTLLNGTMIPEGTFIKLKLDLVPKSADIVFIVEAKSCNENIMDSKSVMTFATSLNKELITANITNNRYSVVTFGGNRPFDKPRSVVINNEIFSEFNQLSLYFEHIKTGNGSNNDVYEAISTASKLIFKPGVSKIFILMPCSNCSASDMKFDYASILQLLMENNIKLHMMVDQEFEMEKFKNKLVYGIDRTKAFTKKDIKSLLGDEDLRKQVKIPKSSVCIPLVFDTTGSMFTTNQYVAENKRNLTKKFIPMFAKSVADTAQPSTCQECECAGYNSGVAYMSCLSCSNTSSSDYDDDELMFFYSNEDEMEETDD